MLRTKRKKRTNKPLIGKKVNTGRTSRELLSNKNNKKKNKTGPKRPGLIRKMIALIIIGSVGYYLTSSGRLNKYLERIQKKFIVNDIETVNFDNVDKDVIKDYIKGLKGKSVFKVNKKDIENIAEKNVLIKKIEIEKHLSGKIKFKAVKRYPITFLRDNNDFLGLSQDGYVISISEQKPKDQIIFNINKKKYSEGQNVHEFNIILKLMKSMNESIKEYVKEIQIKDSEDIIVYVKDRSIKAEMSLDDIENKMKNLSLLLKKYDFTDNLNINLNYKNIAYLREEK